MAPKSLYNEEKRLSIISKVYDYIEVHGVKDFSTTAFIKYYKIGKSSLYHYFKSKDEILHEAFYLLAIDELETIKRTLKKEYSLEDKLNFVFDFYLSDNLLTKKYRDIYLEYLNIYNEKKDEKMKQYDKDLFQKYNKCLNTIFLDEINKGTIKKESIGLIDSLLATSDGMLLYAYSIDGFNLTLKFRQYLDTILKLIKT